MRFSRVREILSIVSRRKVYYDVDTVPEKSRMSALDLVFLGLGCMIGPGVYVLMGPVAKDMTGPAISISFAVAGIVTSLSVFCYAEFGARVPKSASAYTYSYVTVGEFWALVVGWASVLDKMAGAASAARAWSGYFDSLLEHRLRDFTVRHIGTLGALAPYPDFIAFFMILAFMFLVVCGVKSSASINKLLAALNLIVICISTYTGLYHADMTGRSGIDNFAPYGISGIVVGAAACFYSYGGFDVIALYGDETDEPASAIPYATFLSLVLAIIIFVTSSVALILLVPIEAIVPESALPDAFEYRQVLWAKYFVASGALVSLSTTVFCYLFGIPRTIEAMARDGLLFEQWGTYNSRTGTNVNSTVLFGVLTAFLGLLVGIDILVGISAIITLFTYTRMSSSVIIFRYGPHIDFIQKHVDRDKDRVSVMETHTAVLKPRFVNTPLLSGHPPGLNVNVATTVVVMLCLSINYIITISPDAIVSAEWWAITLVTLFASGIILCIVVILMHEENKTSVDFMVPFVPFVPVLGIYLNTLLMVQLSKLVLIPLTLWLSAGILIYLIYGTKHSLEANRAHSPSLYTQFHDEPELDEAVCYQQLDQSETNAETQYSNF